MTRVEHRAAVFYEFLAREHAVKGRPVYTLGEPWIKLPKIFRIFAALMVFKGKSDHAVIEEQIPLFPPDEIIRGGETWSKVYSMRFNLSMTPHAAAVEIQERVAKLQKELAIPKRGLEGRVNRRMSYRPVELRDKELRGEQLSKVEKQCLREFRSRHQATMTNAYNMLIKHPPPFYDIDIKRRK